MINCALYRIFILIKVLDFVRKSKSSSEGSVDLINKFSKKKWKKKMFYP